MPLPIEPVLPQLLDVLAEGSNAVLVAPPGAGKTTLVPPALLGEGWLAGRRIVMLEPRRLAARAAARRMAVLRGERVGQTIGLRMRMDTRVSAQTRIEVITEGILTRMLQQDPALDGVGAVLFDEFHERSVDADLGLALCRQAQQLFRGDLRIVVMSATLAAEPVADLLGGAPVVQSEGRSHAVETHYLDRQPERRIEPAVAAAVRRALAADEGDVLVFLPGAGEIRRTERLLREGAGDVGVDVYPLYGLLPQEQQDRALAPSPAGRRKVVLATSIAETSLTIDGIRVVVDGGLMRVPRFDPRSGMTRLATVRVSRASADQRRGRAGRLAPGVCYRLWSRHQHQHLIPHTAPEIVDADLAPLALELALWGAAPDELAWLDPPPAAAYGQARALLRQLGALDAEGAVTPRGRRMAGMGLHPRLAHMVIEAQTLGHAALACDLVALLGERDVLRFDDGIADVDVRLRLEVMQEARRGNPGAQPYVRGHHVDRRAVRRVLRVSDYWRQRLKPRDDASTIAAAGLLLAFAYPDRIGQRRKGQAGRFRLRNGRAAALDHDQLLSDAEYVVAAQLDGRRRESRIFLAAPVSEEALMRHFGEQMLMEDVVSWDGEARRVAARRMERLGALVLKDAPLRDPEAEAVVDALLDGVRSEGLSMLAWTKGARQLRDRLAFLHFHDPEWPDVSDAALLGTLDAWLRPHLYGIRDAAGLEGLDVAGLLLGRLTWQRRQALDERAPTHRQVPSGSRIRIDYSDPRAPVLAVRLQEVFGMMQTPRIDQGRVPLTLHLLSPALRPVQVTQDLESFWQNAYFDVKKDMKGRYPKHYWPDDPLVAQPTRRVRPKNSGTSS